MNSKLLKKIKYFLNEGKVYRAYQLKEWRGVNGIKQAALKRDHYECQDCSKEGRQTKAVEVHHIKELKDNPELFLKLENVISLCKDCHNKRHNRSFKGNNKYKNNFTTEERW